MNEVKKGKLFIAQVLSRLTGDSNTELASKISRKALSAVEGQISALKGKVVDQENVLEEAEEALQNAIYPTEMIKDNRAYCQGIANTQEKVNSAKLDLEETQESITYFEAILAKF